MRRRPNSDSESDARYDIKLSHKGPPRFQQWPLNSREATKQAEEPRPLGRFGGRCEGDPRRLALPQMERLAMATKALSFDVGDYVVYPKHGVGRVVELQSTEIAGTRLDLYVLRFEKEKMTLRVPVNKADSVGMRKLSSDKTMKDALETLKGKPRVKRTMWSRRAQEYEAKINSGDLTSIAEVTRDLFRPDDAPEQSYSERQIFEAASSRLARELGAMEQTDEK